MQILNIPEELRARPQWAVCRVTNREDPNNKRPMNPRTGRFCSPVDPSTWGTFEEAARTGLTIGYMFHKDDPYSVIDLDNKIDSPVSQEQLDSYIRLIEAADTYTELSHSGRGFHLIMKGSVPLGLNRSSTEVYSDQRFMICTGNIYGQPKPIAERQELLTWFFKNLGGEEVLAGKYTVNQVQPVMSDNDVMQMAWTADNEQKFQALWYGQWRELGYPSQSEADFALMSMLCFYAESDEQCIRLFRQSALGKREKAQRGNYLVDRCLSKIRANQPGPVEIPTLEAMQMNFAPTAQAPTFSLDLPAGSESPAIFSMPIQFTADPSMRLPDEDNAPHLPGQIAGMPKPPGLIGEIADYIYASSERPCAEISMAAAMGLVAGIAGRAYNISRVGLNQYIVLIAKTGTGKEAIGKGMDAIMSSIRRFAPAADTFQGPGAFASGQGLYRILTEKPCFVSVMGEFGLTLHAMSKARPGDAGHTLKRALLDIYNKSGINSQLKPTAYSDKEKNTALVTAPNLTFVGESTPEEFYKALDESAIMDGFVPRLMLIEYKGERPAFNPNAGFAPPDSLVAKVASLANICITAGNQGDYPVAAQVLQDPSAAEALLAFNYEIDAKMEGLPDSPTRQILNRAHLKALKLAGLLAVGVNWNAPVVTLREAEWAMQFVRNEIQSMTTRFESGQVGEGEDPHRFEKAVKAAIDRLFNAQDQEARSMRNAYRIPPKLHGLAVCPRSFLGQYLKGRQPFKADRRGPGKALDETLAEMIKDGALVEVPKIQAAQYGVTGACYIKGGSF